MYCIAIPKSGARLHLILLQTMFHAPQSFFDKTDSGILLNRFSQDMSLVDGPLPVGVIITLQGESLTPIPQILLCLLFKSAR